MAATLFPLILILFISGDDAKQTEPARKPNPFAPSLRQLTDKEENDIDDIIDRFIQYDTGKLKGPDAKDAVSDFQKLGPDAIPALIRGLNRAAKIDHSCPAVTIAKKLARMLRATHDPELLEFARENVGAGITESRHMGVIKDLRVVCLVRKRALANAGATALRNAPTLRGDSTSASGGKDKELSKLSITELVEMVGKERGPSLKVTMTELGKRHGDEVIGALGSAASTYDSDIQKLARDLLARQLRELTPADLKEKLKDDRAEVRAGAAHVVGDKGLHFESPLIDLLGDSETSVRAAAHNALVRLNKGTDLGPKVDASVADYKAAEQKWRAWLEKQGSR